MPTPDKRVKTLAECRTTIMLLNQGHDMTNTPDDPQLRPWWYGDRAHIFTRDYEVLRGDVFVSEREYYDADTMEPLTRKQVSMRIQEYDEWKSSQ